MSCEGKHNNFDFKFCPECGIKLEHEEELVNKLNKSYIEYLEKVKEFRVIGNYITFLNYSKNIDIPVKVCFMDDKFYTMKQYIDETGDEKREYCLNTSVVNCNIIFVGCSSKNIKYYIKQYSIIKKVFPNTLNDEERYIRMFLNNIETLKSKICDKEKIKQLVSEYLDSE